MKRLALFLLGLLLSFGALAHELPLEGFKPPASVSNPASKPTPAPVAKKPLPGAAAEYLPKLKTEIDTYWPSLKLRTFPAGVIDQESNWKINAALKHAREFGCGLGQFTVAYNADGSVRFNAIEETRRLDRSLSGWTLADCYRVDYQLRAVTIKLKMHERNCSAFMLDHANALMCAGGQYNGGAGSTSGRIRLCRMDVNCNPKIWIGNLDQQCTQSKTKVKGYGESFCEINSKYPKRVFDRMPKFDGYL